MSIYVTMTDSFMSGWGQAYNRINKFVVTCQTMKQAEQVERAANKRDEMKYVNISFTKPYYSPKKYLVSEDSYDNLGSVWTRA